MKLISTEKLINIIKSKERETREKQLSSRPYEAGVEDTLQWLKERIASEYDLEGVSDSTAFADWLRANYSPLDSKPMFGTLLPEGKWRKDYTNKIYSTEELYFIFKGSR